MLTAAIFITISRVVVRCAHGSSSYIQTAGCSLCSRVRLLYIQTAASPVCKLAIGKEQGDAVGD